MNYMKITESSCRQFVDKILNLNSEVSEEVILDFIQTHARPAKSTGAVIDLSALQEVSKRAMRLADELSGADKDSVEGAICGDVHMVLSSMPAEVLDDPEFWQYVAILYFTNFILWRESGAASAESGNKLFTYFSGQRNSEMIPLRLFLRGAISKVDDSYELANLLDRSTDFWRSHIIRVTTGTAHRLSQELVKYQSQEGMNTSKLRELAKLLNRQWTNVELYYLKSSEAHNLLEQIESFLSDADQIIYEDDEPKKVEKKVSSKDRGEDFVGKARATDSRAREFDLLFGLLNAPQKLRDLITQSPTGARKELEGIVFEYGNVARLEPGIAVSNPVRPFNIETSHAFHIDNLSQARKLEIEDEFDLRSGSISSRDTKVDLLFVSGTNPYYISFKDADEQAKLGQVSTGTSYLNGKLIGGITDFDFGSRIPDKFTASDTGFSEEQFLRLRPRDRLFAYFKHNFADEWSDYCEARLENANSQILKLGLMMENDRNEFIQFLGQTLAGNLLGDPNYYLVIGSHVVHFNSVLDRLRELDFTIKTEVYKPRDKASFIINFEVGDEKYCVTKIEPSFDGASISAEQTKGIIYYFQQHQKDGNNYKKLLLDVTK